MAAPHFAQNCGMQDEKECLGCNAEKEQDLRKTSSRSGGHFLAVQPRLQNHVRFASVIFYTCPTFGSFRLTSNRACAFTAHTKHIAQLFVFSSSVSWSHQPNHIDSQSCCVFHNLNGQPECFPPINTDSCAMIPRLVRVDNVIDNCQGFRRVKEGSASWRNPHWGKTIRFPETRARTKT